MNIVSIEFIIFILIGVVVFYLIPTAWQWKWLLIMSIVYYTSHSYKAMTFILLSTVSSYCAACMMEGFGKAVHNKKVVIILAVLLNLGLLAFVRCSKYFYEGGGYNSFLPWLAKVPVSFFDFAAPIGISFYTLQVIGYLIDVYKTVM